MYDWLQSLEKLSNRFLANDPVAIFYILLPMSSHVKQIKPREVIVGKDALSAYSGTVLWLGHRLISFRA